MTPLAQWLQRDDIAKAMALLMLGADPNYIDRNDKAPVHHVQSLAALQMLVTDFGASIDVFDVERRTPIFGYRNVDLIGGVLRLGAAARICDHAGITPLHEVELIDGARLLLKHGADIDAQDISGSTPLHSAVLRSQFHVARWLIESGANIDLQDEDGNAPLHIARTEPLIAMLMRHGANDKRVNRAGQTPPEANPLFYEAMRMLHVVDAEVSGRG